MIVSKKTIVELTAQQITEIVAKHLGVEPHEVTADYQLSESGDDRFGPTWKVFSKAQFTINRNVNIEPTNEQSDDRR